MALAQATAQTQANMAEVPLRMEPTAEHQVSIQQMQLLNQMNAVKEHADE